MKRTIGILSLALALTVALFSSQAAMAQQKGAKLTQHQLLSLIATAKTPAQHTEIAEYYEAKAQDYLAQAKEHAESAAAYRKNPMTASSKFAIGTVNHCDYFVQSFKDDAAKMEELAQMHEQMAKDADKK